MGWKEWQQQGKRLITSSTIREPFYILTITLLSLLLPLSFLLLARVSVAHYLLTFTPYPAAQFFSLLFSLFLNTYPPLLYALISFICIATLLHNFINDSQCPIFGPRLYMAWIFLCTIQVCVGLGIEGSIFEGLDGLSFDNELSLISRVLFFIGLHENTLLWLRMVVKPVVDDTVFGSLRKERVAEKLALAASVGSLWWWRLRDEVESLVVVVDVKRDASVGVTWADFVGWWLYYLVVTIGMIRIIKSLMWILLVLICKKVDEGNSVDFHGNEEKV